MANSTMLALKLRSCVILSIDSRVAEKMYGSVLDNAYDKVIQLHPKVFLGCLGDPEVCDALRQNLPPLTADFTPTSVLQAADLVKDVINSYVENFPDTAAEIFVVGAVDLEKKDFKIYKISKEEGHSWKYGVEEVVEQVAMGGTSGRRGLKVYVENNSFNPDMTVDEGILYAFEGIKFSATKDVFTGGEIQVVAINFEEQGFKRRKWRQNNPWRCTDEYHHVA